MAALWAGANWAHGALLAYEGFDYSGSSNLAGQSGGSGFGANNWGNNTQWAIASGGLAYGSLVTTGKATVATRTGSISITRGLSGPVGGDGASIWISFLVQGLDSGPNGLSLYGGGPEGVFAGAPNSRNLGVRFYSGAQHPVSGGQIEIADTLPHDANSTHMFVMNFDMTNPTVPVHRAWVNPDVASLGTGTAPTTVDGGAFEEVSTNTNSYTIDAIRLGLFGGNPTVTFDEIRIGESWVDVSPVPEPSTGLLVGLAGGAVACRRRRLRRER